MKLNYEVFPSNGQVFLIAAANDDEARAFVTDYLKETNEHLAHVIVWNPESRKYDLRNFDVEIEEIPQMRTKEYKLEVRYVKWVRFSGVTREREFDQKIKTAIKSMEILPEQKGWDRDFRSGPVHYTDDERYGLPDSDVEEKKL